MEILQNLGSLPIFLIMIVIIYFLMIRPQLNQQKKHKDLIENLKIGDNIITRGGICGKIVSFKNNDKIVIKSSNESNILILRNSVMSINEKG